jgi:tetratricopeptide (TPR) repeat protein
MMAAMNLPRLRMLTLVGLLPLLLGQCSYFQKKPEPAVRGLTPKESAEMTARHDAWPGDSKRQPPPESLSPDRLEALGEMAMQTRDFETSLIDFMKILKDNPERYDLRYKVGVIFLMTGKLDAAKTELAEVLVHKPDMLQAHEAMGLVLLQDKDYSQAIDEFQLVLSRDPGQVKTRHLLGVTYLEAGQTEKAIYELKKAADQDPHQVSSLIALGEAYNRQKDYLHALTYLKKAEALAPQNQKVHYQMGMALAGQKRYAEALDAFLKGGDEAQAYNNIGVHLFTDGKYEEAAKCFQRAIELKPEFYQEARGNLQRALEKLNQTGKDGS